MLGQEGEDLVFRLRTPLTGENGTEPELVVPNVFASTRARNLVVTYDGRKLLLFVEGLRQSYSLELGPGTALFKHLFALNAFETRGYELVYYGLVFVPLGCLLAFIVKTQDGPAISRNILLGGGILLPAVVHEVLLASVSGRSVSLENLLRGSVLTAATLVFLCYRRR